MIRKTLLIVALPISGLLAQASPIHIVVRSQNGAEFRMVRTTRDSVDPALTGRGVLEVAADGPTAFRTLEIAALDTMKSVHVEATRAGRIIASGDGRYLTVRRDGRGIAIEARSDAPEPPGREIKRP